MGANSEPLLASPALLPLAALARTDSPEALLQTVAAQVGTIASVDEQRNVSACVQLMAGLKFDQSLIHRLFREEVMQESVIYQEIIQRGIAQGELAMVLRQLNRRIGNINPELAAKVEVLSLPKLEELGEALLDFDSEADLVSWLNKR